MTRLVLSESTDAHVNLATEEYFLRETNFDYIFLYLNNPAIIIGKHQNALAEINLPWATANNIPVIRRLSGGGTVFHDPGNINFCFIRNGEPGRLADMAGFAQPVIRFLQSLGLNAFLGEKNDIRLPEGKVSGNAEHIYRNRVMHHGTLLFNTDLSALNESIRIQHGRFTDKAVKSNRSIVTNLNSHIPFEGNVHDFVRLLMKFFSKEVSESEVYSLSLHEQQRVKELIATRYSTWEWNFGYSPSFRLNFTFLGNDGFVEVAKGSIIQVIVNYQDDLSFELTSILRSCRFYPSDIEFVLNNHAFAEPLLEAFFQ
jgi:lipoate---protein ligase